MQNKPVSKKEKVLGPIGPDDPICPYFDRENRVCVSPHCQILHTTCKFWDPERKRR